MAVEGRAKVPKTADDWIAEYEDSSVTMSTREVAQVRIAMQSEWGKDVVLPPASVLSNGKLIANALARAAALRDQASSCSTSASPYRTSAWTTWQLKNGGIPEVECEVSKPNISHKRKRVSDREDASSGRVMKSARSDDWADESGGELPPYIKKIREEFDYARARAIIASTEYLLRD